MYNEIGNPSISKYQKGGRRRSAVQVDQLAWSHAAANSISDFSIIFLLVSQAIKGWGKTY